MQSRFWAFPLAHLAGHSAVRPILRKKSAPNFDPYIDV
jgi:hypothetical protein